MQIWKVRIFWNELTEKNFFSISNGLYFYFYFLFFFFAGLKTCNFFKKRHQHRCFPVKSAKFLRTPILRKNSGGYFWNQTCASAVLLLHIRIGNLDWCKCRHCKNEGKEIDCLSCREVNAILIASAKIPEREGSISPCRFMGNCLTVSHTCLLYLPRRWVFLFVAGVTERNEHAGWI